MSTTHITPTPGRIVWYRGADGEIRPAIVIRGNGQFNADLYVFPLNPADTDWGNKATVTHADPEQEPGCLQSWHWMPYQKQQAEKHATVIGAAIRPAILGDEPRMQLQAAEHEPSAVWHGQLPTSPEKFKEIFDAAAVVSTTDERLMAETPALQPHQQRVVDEKRDLDEKRAKLIAFFATPTFAALPADEKDRLEAQEHFMGGYANVLADRIAHF